jgi:hypothetical protein
MWVVTAAADGDPWKGRAVAGASVLAADQVATGVEAPLARAGWRDLTMCCG